MATSVTTSRKEYIGGQDNSDGKVLGYSADDKVGFFGATPVVQQTSATSVATTVSISTTSAKWGFATSTQADAIVTAVNQIITILENLGLSA